MIRLEDNYRSTPEVLDLANRLVPNLGGAEKTLRPVLPGGPEPEVRPFATADAEAAYLVDRIRAATCQLEEIAILARTHARLADVEEVLTTAGIPSQGAALLSREAARRVSALARPRRAGRAGPVRSRPISAGCRIRPRSSARGSRRARATSRASFGSQTRSAGRAGTSARSSSAVTATAATGGRASTYSRTTARRASSSRSSCFRASRRRSCLPSSPARRRRSTRSAACSTSA